MKLLKKSAVSIFIVFFIIFILPCFTLSKEVSIFDLIYSIMMTITLFKL